MLCFFAFIILQEINRYEIYIFREPHFILESVADELS